MRGSDGLENHSQQLILNQQTSFKNWYYLFYQLNQQTVKLAPPEVMQFGQALDRLLLSTVQANPHRGPVHLMKIDISDGFYRVKLSVHDVVRLAAPIPPLVGMELLIVLPLILPMGWMESPPS
jgi:hypothetical protein